MAPNDNTKYPNHIKEYTISALSDFILCVSRATKLAQNYCLSHGFCWKDDFITVVAHLANQEMRLITVGLGFFGVVGWSDLKGEK